MLSRTVTIVNRLGLHARAASRLVNCASSFSAQVWISRGQREVNCKSIMGVLTLAAGRGTELGLRTDGSDEEAAMNTISDLIADYFGEGE
jgi:phosphocarrier protein HPr